MKDWLKIGLLTAIWLLAILLVNPIGDFPLNDDFSYARSTMNFSEGGSLRFDPWLSMTLLAQVLWGTAFCKLFGFSFTVLRCSTLVLGWLGILAGYRLVRELGQGRQVAFLLAAMLAFNPLFFSLSFTYMTDVPFFAFTMLSVLFYVRFFKENQLRWMLLGSCFAMAAVFVRQLGLLLPLAFTVTILVRGGLRPKALLTAFVPLAIMLGLFFWYSDWLAHAQGLPEGYGNFKRLKGVIGWDTFNDIPLRIGVLSVYLGSFLLPLVALVFPSLRNGLFAKNNGTAWLPSLIVGVAIIFAWPRLPWANVLYNLGLGPKLLKDGYYFINVQPIAPAWVVNLLIFSGFCGAMAAIYLLVKNGRERFSASNPQHAVATFGLTCILLYGGFLMLDVHCFDRYFIQMLPFLLVLILPAGQQAISPKRFWLAGAMLLLVAAFSIAATHDYLAWNRARWQALDFLTEEKSINPDRIDGGFEFNGWHRPTPIKDQNGPKSDWWVVDDEYVVAFGNMDGYKKMTGFPYTRWLPPGVDSVFVLKRWTVDD
ncbi:MAG: glycosyltransferase family 39 protein [Saprospiraceae bacterium]|nr:glycosyltransferase family 39 protein [Saprospiraceae bacterium]